MNRPVLVCFAVPQEARPFRRMIHGHPNVRPLVTGMGGRNAGRAVHDALLKFNSERVFTCGFAGGLNPDLKVGAVLFESSSTSDPIATRLKAAGANAASFFCAERVAITVAEKKAMRALTGADAVEMESAFVQDVCRKASVDCVTVRVISDAANENLPLDFNTLMTGDYQLSPIKLAWAILKAPKKIPALMRLGRNSSQAARNLADVLIRII